MAEVTLEGRAGTRLEPSQAGVGQAWGWTGVQVGGTGARLALGWRGTLVMLSDFAACPGHAVPLAAVGGRGGCTQCSEGWELCGCFLGCVGMIRHGAHLQLPMLASVTSQERHGIKPA